MENGVTPKHSFSSFFEMKLCYTKRKVSWLRKIKTHFMILVTAAHFFPRITFGFS